MTVNRRILIFCIAGGVFVAIAGTLGHFVYDWTGGAKWAAVLFPVNESTWEHLKLVIFPAAVYFGAGAYFMRSGNNYISAAFLFTAVACAFITGGFYAYTAIFGKSFLPMDIFLFLGGIALGATAAYYILRSETFALLNVLSFFGIIALGVCFFTFTFYPPQTFLFLDPVTGGYGIPA